MIKSQIFSNALKTMKYLNPMGVLSVVEQKEQLNLNEQEIYLALGWLAHENKILYPNSQQRWIQFY
jgi:hypothetical protein